MGPWMAIASLISGMNVVLLAVLIYIWGSNYRTFRTPLVLGLIAFGGVLLVENLIAIYFFFSMEMLYSSHHSVQQVVMFLRGLQFVAVAFLTWVSWK